MKNIINKKAIKNAFYTLLGTVKKALTHNRCDSCGFTKEQVYVTEHFTESGWIECKPCYNNRSNSICAKAEPLIIEMNKDHLVELYNFAYEQAVKTGKVDELKEIDGKINGC